MNRRRVLAIIAAVVLTLFGTLVLIVYVNSAADRALQDTELVSILVASEEIPAGTPAADIGPLVQQRLVPRQSRAADAVVDLDNLGDQVTVERILTDEPIVERHFGDAVAAQRPGQAQIDEGREIITITLDSQRALGGQLAQGDLVGVIVSLSGGAPDDATTDPAATSGGAGDVTTGMVLAGVPVVGLEGAADEESGEATDAVTISLDVDQSEAERIAFAAEFGRIWLTRQTDQTPGVNNQVQEGDDFFDNLGGGS